MNPVEVRVRSYQVGFGDCFLLTVRYDEGPARHVLIDFGSVALPAEVSKRRITEIAKDIASYTGGKLTAVVATHRHKDHISGFATNEKGTASGDIIAGLEPDLVVQPWTEDPSLPAKATGAKTKSSTARLNAVRARSLDGMQAIAAALQGELKRSRSLPREVREQIASLSEINVKNASAVNNLMTMSKRREYLHFGMKTSLERLLPGAEVHVLGPPTVDQHAKVAKEKDWDPDEYWLRLQKQSQATTSRPKPAFPRHVVERTNYRFPIDARWLIYRAKRLRAEQMKSIVTSLDKALNNTSVILLFKIGTKALLFPGDAQLENWEYALAQPDVRKLLEKVDLYKVGHHGSRNATPKSLWEIISGDPKSRKRLTSVMSTMPGVYGETEATKVPRSTLVNALRRRSTLHSTQDIPSNELFTELTFKV